MAQTEHNGEVIHTAGNLPTVGGQLPDFNLDAADLSQVGNQTVAGSRVIFNIFPSIDTGVCAMSVRKFNELAASLPNTKVVCVSKDLPFALGRFCGAEGIENVITTSAFRSSFGEDFGVTMIDGPLRGLLARSIVVADEQGKVSHTELVAKISSEPDYDAAVAALG
ncbi:MAG: thiol peroxidase [Propionibacteriaceae bacterium]|jgi:thiol peroxidase|nr:thiol peroxidase [Propionibacteriaceae bacterium]